MDTANELINELKRVANDYLTNDDDVDTIVCRINTLADQIRNAIGTGDN